MIYQKRYNIIPDNEGFIQLKTNGLESSRGQLISVDSRKGSIINDSLSSADSRGEEDWLATFTTSGAALVVSSTNSNHISGIQLKTGTNTTGAAFYSRGQGSFINGQGAVLRLETVIYTDALSTTTDEYAIVFGFIDNLSTIESTNGIYFKYDRANIASPNEVKWHFVTASGGTRTVTNTGNTVVSASYVRLGLVLNLTGTQADAYIDGNLVCSNITNIPNGVNQSFTAGIGVIKSNGTTSRSIQVARISQSSVLGNLQ